MVGTGINIPNTSGTLDVSNASELQIIIMICSSTTEGTFYIVDCK